MKAKPQPNHQKQLYETILYLQSQRTRLDSDIEKYLESRKADRILEDMQERNDKGNLNRDHAVAKMRGLCATLLRNGLPPPYRKPLIQLSLPEIAATVRYTTHSSATTAIKAHRETVDKLKKQQTPREYFTSRVR